MTNLCNKPSCDGGCDQCTAALRAIEARARVRFAKAEERFATLEKKCESPAEVALLGALIDYGLTFEQQWLVLAYRLDFAFPVQKIAVEVDGITYHNTPEAFEADRRRDRELSAIGWTTVRFSASEVFKRSLHCARQVADLVKQRAA